MDTKLVVESAGMTVVCGEFELTVTNNISGKSIVLKSTSRHIIVLPRDSTYRMIPYSEKGREGGMTF